MCRRFNLILEGLKGAFHKCCMDRTMKQQAIDEETKTCRVKQICLEWRRTLPKLKIRCATISEEWRSV